MLEHLEMSIMLNTLELKFLISTEPCFTVNYIEVVDCVIVWYNYAY